MTVFRLLRNDLGFVPQRVTCPGLFIGRALANELVLNDLGIADVHAGICLREDVYWLSNFAETGTKLNGQPITHAPLVSGDLIEIGPYVLSVAQLPALLQLEVSKQAPSDCPAWGDRPALTPEIETELQQFWQPLREALPLKEREEVEKTPDVATERRPVRWLKAALLAVLLLIGLALLTAMIYPRAFAPGGISSAHARKGLPALPAHAQKPITQRCMDCHQISQPVQKQCVACHSTNGFQPVIASKHESLKLQCVLCHQEHRGAQAQLKRVANSTCLACHQGSGNKSLHGAAVRYPVNRFGVWSWEGISPAAWSEHQLPGLTADYTLREQFHMLHGEGRAQGRTRCTDCHLGGTATETLKLNVRESCAQCHTLAPTLTAELATLAKSAPLKQGATLCTACHAQHGSERDARASVRKE